MRPAALVAVLALAGAVPAAVDAQVPNLQNQIRDSRRRLEEIRTERRELRRAMDQLEARAHTISAELDNLGKQIDITYDALRELELQIATTEEAVRVTTADLIQTQDLLVLRRTVLERRVRDIYKRGPLSDIQVLLAAESFADLIHRYKYLYLVTVHDRMLIREVTELERRLIDQERKLRVHLDDLQHLRQDKLGELRSLEGLQGERSRRLAGTERERRVTRTRLEELERDEAELAGLLTRLERERREAERRAAVPPSAGALTTRSLGQLDWPVEGTILYPFGRQEVASGAAIRRNGIGIQAPRGAPVRVVEAGQVVFAEPYFGYGPSVIVSHGGGYYSLYLYLDSIGVGAGDRVRKGQVIGTVGGAPTPEGVHMEFQIREPGGQAVDPLRWLRSRRE